MPGDKKHHTAKMHSCIEKVMASGKGEDSAYAICTTTLQKAGEPIFEGAESRSLEELRLLAQDARTCQPRHLHLLGATGLARRVVEAGKNWLVVPVVALMEGVIHAVNAQTPEFVPLATLQKAAASWNGKPVTLGHPKRDGKQCSAESPDVQEAHGIGVIKNSRVEGAKMLQEAWIDCERAKKLNPEAFARLEANQREEVSVGAFVITDGRASNHNGRAYMASWIEAAGDHLAFLPGGRGACSVAMGCGTHRAASHLVTAEALVPEDEIRLPTVVFTALEEQPLDERLRLVHVAIEREWSDPPPPPAAPWSYAYAIAVFDDRVVVRKGEETFSVDYDVKDGKVVFGKKTPVKQAWVAAEGGALRAAVGARNSMRDAKMIQTVHDHAVALGARCDRGNYETAEEACACGGHKGACGCEKDVTLQERPIRFEGGRFVLYSQDGRRKLAEHGSMVEAKAHAQAIQLALARRAAS